LDVVFCEVLIITVKEGVFESKKDKVDGINESAIKVPKDSLRCVYFHNEYDTKEVCFLQYLCGIEESPCYHANKKEGYMLFFRRENLAKKTPFLILY